MLDNPALETKPSLRSSRRVADTDSMLRYDIEPVHPVGAEVPGEGDLSFAVFSLVHAACGDDVLEVRIGERMLLEWCTGCAVMEVFASCET
jgi:hypothetical protein